MHVLAKAETKHSCFPPGTPDAKGSMRNDVLGCLRALSPGKVSELRSPNADGSFSRSGRSPARLANAVQSDQWQRGNCRTLCSVWDQEIQLWRGIDCRMNTSRFHNFIHVASRRQPPAPHRWAHTAGAWFRGGAESGAEELRREERCWVMGYQVMRDPQSSPWAFSILSPGLMEDLGRISPHDVGHLQFYRRKYPHSHKFP